MNKIVFTLTYFLITTILLAQNQPQFNFQAVLRDGSGQLLIKQEKTVTVEILKGSLNGSVVFTENHLITSSEAGVINLKIGSVSDLSIINWSSDSYFIKIYVDSHLMGTSQFLSVPYALHAEKAGTMSYHFLENTPQFAQVSMSGSYIDLLNQPTLFDGSYPSLSDKPITDWTWSELIDKPTFHEFSTSGSISDLSDIPFIFNGDYHDLNGKPELFGGSWQDLSAKPDFAQVATSGLYNDLVDKPLIDGSETILIPGAHITISGKGSDSDPFVLGTVSPLAHYIGEFYDGGIICWLSPDKNHGLILSVEDLHTKQRWGDTVLVANASSMIDGLANTLALVSIADNSSNSAGQVCLDYTYGGFDDWYLPAAWQMTEVYNNLTTLNNALINDNDPNTEPVIDSSASVTEPYPQYWVSTEGIYKNGWILNLISGQIEGKRKDRLVRVRAMRSF